MISIAANTDPEKMDQVKAWTMFEPWPEESSRRLENDCDCDECGPASARKRQRHGQATAAALPTASVQQPPPRPKHSSRFPSSTAEPPSPAEPLASCRGTAQGAAQDGSGPPRLKASRSSRRLAARTTTVGMSLSLSQYTGSLCGKQPSHRAIAGMPTAKRKEHAAVAEDAAGYM